MQVAVTGPTLDSSDLPTDLADKSITSVDKFKADQCGAAQVNLCEKVQADQCLKVCI